jgi:hypothetical protein
LVSICGVKAGRGSESGSGMYEGGKEVGRFDEELSDLGCVL